MVAGELVVSRGGRIEQSHGCPDHLTVDAVERCPRCAAVFWERQEKLRGLDRAGAVPPIPGPR